MFYKRAMSMPNNQTEKMTSGMVHYMTVSSLSAINRDLGVNLTEADVHTRGVFTTCHDPDLRSFQFESESLSGL
jgi:hypothetical protein